MEDLRFYRRVNPRWAGSALARHGMTDAGAIEEYGWRGYQGVSPSAANMQSVDIHEAEMRFSMLVDAAENGEEIIITKAGKPVAKMGPFRRDQALRRFGGLKGRVRIADDFDVPYP